MRIIDTSGALESGMWSYPDPYPKVRMEEISQPDRIPHGAYSWQFTLGVQTDTYPETAADMFRDAITIDQVLAERLFSEAVMIKVRDKGPNQPVEVAELMIAGIQVCPGAYAAGGHRVVSMDN